MRLHSLSTGFPEKRDIPHMRFPEESYLEFTSVSFGLLLFLALSFFFPLLLFFDFLHSYVFSVFTDTWM